MVLAAQRRTTGSLFLLLVSTCTAAAAPFATRDQNPLLAGLGLPRPMPARIAAESEGSQGWQLAADFNWGNSAIVQSNARESLIVDAETRELRVTIGRSIADRFAVQLQIPYRHTGAGTLDGFIDNWHSWFSLPEGARPELPVDQYQVTYVRDGMTALDLRSSSSGLADICADVGYQIIAGGATAAAAWLSLKLPTGDADKLTGSGATDLALAIAGEHRFADRWSVFGQAGVSYLGAGDLLADQQRSVVWSALAGVGVSISQRLDLKMQLDAHSAAFDRTELDFLGDTAVLTVGGSYRFSEAWQVEVGVSEDVVVDASPDVVLVLGVRRAL
jgi:hypothetical protein